MSDPAIQTGTASAREGAPGNTVAAIGLILTLIAGLMCGVLFAAASQLPAPRLEPESPDGAVEDTNESGDAEPSADSIPPERTGTGTDSASTATADPATAEVEPVDPELAAQQLQVLLLASATAVLNLVGLVLCAAGLFIPDRPRGVAICGTILALCLFAGVFGVMAVGGILDPGVTNLSR